MWTSIAGEITPATALHLTVALLAGCCLASVSIVIKRKAGAGFADTLLWPAGESEQASPTLEIFGILVGSMVLLLLVIGTVFQVSSRCVTRCSRASNRTTARFTRTPQRKLKTRHTSAWLSMCWIADNPSDTLDGLQPVTSWTGTLQCSDRKREKTWLDEYMIAIFLYTCNCKW